MNAALKQNVSPAIDSEAIRPKTGTNIKTFAAAMAAAAVLASGAFAQSAKEFAALHLTSPSRTSPRRS